MDVVNHIIEPERQGLWIAAAFTLALLAFGTAFIAIDRGNTALVGTQAQIIGLNNKIEMLKEQGKAEAPAAAAAPDAAAK